MENSTKSDNKLGDQTQLQKYMKEVKLLRGKVDLLELENKLLKKSLFELTNKLGKLKINHSIDPFVMDEEIEIKDEMSSELEESKAIPPISRTQTSRPQLLRVERELTGHSGAVYVVKYHPAGTLLASGSFDRTVRVHNLETGTEPLILSQHNLTVSDLSFHPHLNQIATSSFDQHVRLFDLESGKLVNEVKTKGLSQCLGFNDLGTWLTVGTSRNNIKVIDFRNNNFNHESELETDAMINSLLIPKGQDNHLITGDSMGLIKLWDIRTLTCILTLPNSLTNKPISSLTQPTNALPTSTPTFATNGYDNFNRIYTLDLNSLNYKNTHTLQGYKNLNWPIRNSMLTVDRSLNPDNNGIGYLFASGSADPHAYIYSLGMGEDQVQMAQRLDGHKGRVYDVSFHPTSPNLKLATASADATVKLWHPNS